MTSTPFNNSEVEYKFENYPENIKLKLLYLRELIFAVASNRKEVGQLEETLKWGQPSYLTPKTRSGTTIRIDQVKNKPCQFAIYVSCQTTLIETFRRQYPELSYEGNRAILLDCANTLPIETLKDCISMTLTYHSRKKN